MYCGECGAKNKKDAEFCGECGAKLEHEETEKVEKEEIKKEKKVVKTVKKEVKKPMSKGKKVGLIIVLILVVALIFGYNYLSKKYSAEGVATDYIEALISNDPNRIYDTLNVSSSEFTSKEEFKKMFEENYENKTEVLNYTLTDIEYEDGNLSAEVEFKVMLKDSSEENTVNVKVVKDSKKKFLIFDSWYVYNESNSFVVNDYTINVPKNSTVNINDKDLDKKYIDEKESSEEEDVYVIPQIFVGKATIKTLIPWGIEITKEVNISPYNDSYTADVTLDTLSEDMVNKLQEQVKKDINNIYANVINKKDWNGVKDSYSYNDVNLSELQEEYTDLYDELTEDDDKVLKKFDVSNVTLSTVSIDDNKLKVRAKFNYNYTIDYKNFKDEQKTYDGNSSYYTTITYDYFDNEFKVNDISSLVTYFATR